MSAAITAAVVTAGAAAYGAYSQNKAQREAAKAARDASGPTTTTRSPYAPTEPHVLRAIEEAGRLYDQGLHQQAAAALRRVPGATEAFQGLVGDVTNRARNPSDTLAAGQDFVQDLLGGGVSEFDPTSWAATYQPKWQREAGWSPEQSAEWARKNPDTQLGQMLSSAEGAAAERGPAGPFARNPIYNELYGTLSGSNMDRSYDLLSEFIGGGGGAGFTPSGGTAQGVRPAGGDQGTPAATGPRWRQLGFGSRQEAAQAAREAGFEGDTARQLNQGLDLLESSGLAPAQRQPAPGPTRAPAPTRRAPSRSFSRPATGTGRGGVPPDTMAQDSFFSEEARKFFDPSRLDPASDPTLQPYIDALRQQMQDEFETRADQLGDRFASSNMFSGSGRALALGEASGDLDQALAAEIARTYLGSRGDALDRQERLLGQISNRDLAAMGDLTNRYGIDTSAATARAGIGASRAAQEEALAFERERLGAQTDLQTRAQNLQAILGIQGGERFGMDMLAGLGGALDSRQFGALGAIPGLEGTEQGWYGMALGGEEALSGQRQRAGAARARGAADAALAPGRDLDDYMRRIMGPATAFGTTTGQGPAPPRYSGPSSGEALAGGLLGGAAQGFGTYMQFRGQGQGQNPPTTQNYDYYGDYLG